MGPPCHVGMARWPTATSKAARAISSLCHDLDRHRHAQIRSRPATTARRPTGRRRRATCRRSATPLDGVPGRFVGVLPSRRAGPPDLAASELLDLPAGALLHAMVVTTFGAAVAQAGAPACLVGGIVFEVALGGGPSAGRGGTGRVPDLGQVPERDARIVAAGLVPVIAL